MKIIYDSEVDILTIVFSDNRIEESDEEKPGMIFDYDALGNVVRIEIVNASKKIKDPMAIEYAINRHVA